MASTGLVFAGTGENNAGIGATAWTNPGNVTANDAADATCSAGASSQYLVARNFGFSVPSGASIAGITVTVEASEHSAGTETLNARLQDDSGALVGSGKTVSVNGTTKTVYTYGGTSDVWGASLTQAIVNDPDFGVRLWFTTSHDVRIDYVQMAVEYTVGSSALTTAAATGGQTAPGPGSSKTPSSQVVTGSAQSVASVASQTALVGSASSVGQGFIARGGGQEIVVGQGSVAGGQPLSGSAVTVGQGDVSTDAGAPVAEIITGEQSAVGQGASSQVISLPLRSRKVGGGAATFALGSQLSPVSIGAVSPAPQIRPTTVAALLSAGSVGRASTKALVGSSSDLVQGAVIASGSTGAASFSTAIALSASSAGTYPYEAAIYPLRGDVPSGNRLTSADDANLATSVLSTHDDGSAAVVVVSGSVTLAANQTKMVALAASASAGSAALTAARIATVMGASTVVVNFAGTYGSATLSDYSTPERVWWANSQVIVARYRLAAPTPGATKLEAYIDIHAYASSARALVEVTVENGKVTIGSPTIPGAATYTGATVSIGATTVATINSPTTTTIRGSSLYTANTHQEFRAWFASAWVGGDPDVAVVHDVGYLQRHPLLFQLDKPTDQEFTRSNQYGPDLSTDNIVYATMAYAPWGIGEHKTSFATGGDDITIGPLAKWDTQYLQTGNRHVRNAVIVNALSALSYPINYRDVTTGAVPTLDQTLAAGVFRGSDGNSNEGGLPQLPFGSGIASALPYWDNEHAPAVGLMAFLVRPSPVFIEIAQKAGFFAHTYTINGTYNAAWAGRSKAWGSRNLAHAMFLTPTTMPSGGSRSNSEVTGFRSAAKDALGRCVAQSYASWVTSPRYSNPLNVMYTGTPHSPQDEAREAQGDGAGGFESSIWLDNWQAVEWHRIDKARLLAGHAQDANLTAWIDWALQTTPKMVNESTGGEWRFVGNRTTIGQGGASDNFTDVNPQIFANWGAAFAWRRGTAPALSGQWYGGDASSGVQTNYTIGGSGNWFAETTANPYLADGTFNYSSHFWGALATAKERGVTGADTAWTTVNANITNLSTWRSGFARDPREGVFPRTVSGLNYVNPNWPSWRRSMQPGTWKKVGGVMNAINPLNDPTLNPYYGGTGPLGQPSPWQNIPASLAFYGIAAAVEGFTAVTEDWCGGAYRAGTTKLYVSGGGHNGYAGNEVISIDLSAESPAWSIERPPTGWKGSASEGITLSDGQEASDTYSNGDPRSAHTYNLFCWVGSVMYLVPVNMFENPNAENSTAHKLFKFTPGTPYGSWSYVSDLPSGTFPGLNLAGCLTYDSTRNSLIVCSANARPVWTYSLSGGTWSQSSGTVLTDADIRGIYIPSVDLVVYLNSIPSGKFTLYKPSAGTTHSPGATGTAPAPTAVAPSGSSSEHYANGEWVPSLGCIVTWAEGGTGFHTLTPPASGDPTTTPWTWARIEASAANTVSPDTRTPNGVYGRFFYSPELNCLGVVTSTTGQLNIFALL